MQAFVSGADELLELCKATYELHRELKMDYQGQPVKARPNPFENALTCTSPAGCWVSMCGQLRASIRPRH